MKTLMSLVAETGNNAGMSEQMAGLLILKIIKRFKRFRARSAPRHHKRRKRRFFQ